LETRKSHDRDDNKLSNLINATFNGATNDVQWIKHGPMAMDVALTQSDLPRNTPLQLKSGR